MQKIKNFNKFLKLIVPKKFVGITLYPFGIYIRKEKQNERIINHEKIHLAQQKEMLILFFYLFYILEWIYRVFKKSGYKKLSFEREAKLNERDSRYLEFRKSYAWSKYLF